MKNQQIIFVDWGHIGYEYALSKQEELFASSIKFKQEQAETPNFFIVCEHDPVYTLGKSGNEKNMLLSKEMLTARGATLIHTNRGGDITYHGPGQIVGYPIIDIENFQLTLRHYIYLIEETIIQTLAHYNIHAQHYPEATGVWLDSDNAEKRRKICAIGVKASHFITMHGFALNLNTDLSYFQAINPCGFVHGKVASIHQEMLNQGVEPHLLPTFQEVSELLYNTFEKLCLENIQKKTMPE